MRIFDFWHESAPRLAWDHNDIARFSSLSFSRSAFVPELGKIPDSFAFESAGETRYLNYTGRAYCWMRIINASPMILLQGRTITRRKSSQSGDIHVLEIERQYTNMGTRYGSWDDAGVLSQVGGWWKSE